MKKNTYNQNTEANAVGSIEWNSVKISFNIYENLGLI